MTLASDGCMVSVYNTTSKTRSLIRKDVCGKHGKCVALDRIQFKCNCEIGWTGQLCDKRKRIRFNFINFQLTIEGWPLLPNIDFYLFIFDEDQWKRGGGEGIWYVKPFYKRNQSLRNLSFI